MIDVAPELELEHLEQILEDCLRRRLFTIDEARDRLDQPDMAERPGALLVRRALMS